MPCYPMLYVCTQKASGPNRLHLYWTEPSAYQGRQRNGSFQFSWLYCKRAFEGAMTNFSSERFSLSSCGQALASASRLQAKRRSLRLLSSPASASWLRALYLIGPHGFREHLALMDKTTLLMDRSLQPARACALYPSCSSYLSSDVILFHCSAGACTPAQADMLFSSLP